MRRLQRCYSGNCYISQDEVCGGFSVFPPCSSLKNCLLRGENIFRQLKLHSSSSHIHGKKICEPLNIHPKLPNQWITFALSYLSSTFYHKVTRFSIHINPTEKQQQTQQKNYYIIKSFFYVETVMCWYMFNMKLSKKSSDL